MIEDYGLRTHGLKGLLLSPQSTVLNLYPWILSLLYQQTP
jgi:hypothetical protein